MINFNELRPLTMDEIKDRLIKMEVGINGQLPIKFFGFIVKQPEYDIDNFSQEIEDSKKCQAKMLVNRFVAQCIEHLDGTRNYYSNEVIDKIQEVLDEYKEIYDFY